MAEISYVPTAGITINGIVKTSPIPTSVLKGTGTFGPGALDATDEMQRPYLVNAGTTKTALDLGKIVTCKGLWLQCDGALDIYLTQDFGAGAVENKIRLESFIYLQSTILAVSVANTGATARNLHIIAVGDRLAAGTGPGLF